MAYITESNLKKITRKYKVDSIGNVQIRIYNKDIYFLNRYEKNQLKATILFFKNPKEFHDLYFNRILVEDSKKYIYPEKQPSYHKDRNCEMINHNFTNFEIPNEIRTRGDKEIFRLRAWFKENQDLYKSDITIFWEKLKLEFKLERGLKEVDYRNSSVAIPKLENLKEISNHINQYIVDAGKFYNESKFQKIIRRFQKLTYLAYSNTEIYSNDTEMSDKELKDFLREYDIKFKKPVKDLLFEYYRLFYNEGMLFKEEDLENVGFRPCTSCYPIIE